MSVDGLTDVTDVVIDVSNKFVDDLLQIFPLYPHKRVVLPVTLHTHTHKHTRAYAQANTLIKCILPKIWLFHNRQSNLSLKKLISRSSCWPTLLVLSEVLVEW